MIQRSKLVKNGEITRKRTRKMRDKEGKTIEPRFKEVPLFFKVFCKHYYLTPKRRPHIRLSRSLTFPTFSQIRAHILQQKICNKLPLTYLPIKTFRIPNYAQHCSKYCS